MTTDKKLRIAGTLAELAAIAAYYVTIKRLFPTLADFAMAKATCASCSAGGQFALIMLSGLALIVLVLGPPLAMLGWLVYRLVKPRLTPVHQ
jgi:hypothetical protein